MTYRFRWHHPLSIALLAITSFSVQRLVRAAPPPSSNDVAAAGRVVAPPSGTTDEREASPPPKTLATGYGIVEPVHPETRVAAPLPGRIKEVRVHEGQRVAIGDPLIVLDDDVEKAALAAATADVAGAQAQLERAVRGSRREDIEAAMADADTAKARAALSQGVAERLQQVQASGGATVDELDRARRQSDADTAA
ncbi:MAG TPA: biotin/lipoyl-binding protein, partial [Kofleriaceae bacterium]